jgi:hypothetical protein
LVSSGTIELDQGIVLMMIECYCAELIWKLMRDCLYISTALRRTRYRAGRLSWLLLFTD